MERQAGGFVVKPYEKRAAKKASITLIALIALGAAVWQWPALGAILLVVLVALFGWLFLYMAWFVIDIRRD